MSVKSNTVSFCCGCLNTEANLRNVDKKTANILSGFLGLQIINNYTIKHICITCYELLLKSVRFKEQCLEARELYLSMVHVTEDSLNTLYKLNFKPNLTQTEVTILSIDGSPPFLKTDDNTAIPEVKQIKVELKEEIVENESVLEEEFNLMQGNGFDLENYVVGDPNVAENAKVVIEVDAPENVSFPTYMKLHEEFDIKEDSPQEDSLDIGDESGTHSDDDTSLNRILKREVQNVSEETDFGTIAMHNTLSEVPQNAKRIKVEETAMDINCTVNADLKSLLKTNYKVSNINFPKNVSADSNVDISKSKQIIQSTENCYEVNIMSPRVNIKTEKVQAKDVIVQNYKTLNSNVCYGNAENETLKPCFKSIDTVAQNTLLDRNHEEKQTKMSNKQASENEFTCNTYQNKFVIENVLNIHNRKQSEKKRDTMATPLFSTKTAEFIQNNILPVGTNIPAQARVVINNVLNFFTEVKIDPEKLQSVNFCRSRELAAAICGVSVRTVDKIKKECTKGEVSSPRESVYRPCTVTALDDFDKSVIKQIVSSFYWDGEYPSTAKILSRAIERIDGFQSSISSMRKILIELGYKYIQAPDGRKQLMERTDIVCARLQFLRKIKTLRDSEDTRPRIYLDETWVNQNHSRKRIRLDEDGQGGLNTKMGKGGRLIVCHAGCAKYGFIPEARWVFRAMKSKIEDNHSEMNAKGFTHWFIKLLQSLEEPSVIIMDNAPYHCQQISRAPTSANKKSEIQEWLREHGIEYSNSELKPELLQKVQRNRPEKMYELDHLALESGHEVIRLPSYHCQYNPIELVWAQVKNEVASKNRTFKIADVEVLLHEAISNVSQKNWEDCVKHAEKLQEEDLKKSHLAEEFVIHVDDDDPNDSDIEF